MKPGPVHLRVFLVAVAFALGAGPGTAGPRAAAYVPGLGDIMGAIQTRHAKLWFAGEARNWPLAAYELEEIEEAFDDAATHHPTFRGKPIARMIEAIVMPPARQVGKAIEARDVEQFTRTFDAMSAACNACHQATGHGFIVIQRPTAPPVTNQRFEVLR